MWSAGQQGGGAEQTGHLLAGSWDGHQLAWKWLLGAGMLLSLPRVRSVF